MCSCLVGGWRLVYWCEQDTRRSVREHGKGIYPICVGKIVQSGRCDVVSWKWGKVVGYQHIAGTSFSILEQNNQPTQHLNSVWITDFIRLFKKFNVQLKLRKTTIRKH